MSTGVLDALTSFRIGTRFGVPVIAGTLTAAFFSVSFRLELGHWFSDAVDTFTFLSGYTQFFLIPLIPWVSVIVRRRLPLRSVTRVVIGSIAISMVGVKIGVRLARGQWGVEGQGLLVIMAAMNIGAGLWWDFAVKTSRRVPIGFVCASVGSVILMAIDFAALAVPRDTAFDFLNRLGVVDILVAKYALSTLLVIALFGPVMGICAELAATLELAFKSPGPTPTTAPGGPDAFPVNDQS